MRRRLAFAVLFAGAAALGAVGAPPSASPKFAVPFIDDDYARALKEARAKNVPIFVENWAPW